MTPGSLLLGNPGECFQCSHTYATGDRCLSFHCTDEYFRHTLHAKPFRTARIPPVAALSPVIALASAASVATDAADWEELAVRLCGQIQQLSASTKDVQTTASTLRRITRIVREIEAEPGKTRTLDEMARAAGVSPYHFLRAFTQAAGATPHQFLLRIRLQRAAVALRRSDRTILEVALEAGFQDASHFNRQFRREFGMSPGAYRSLRQYKHV